jgi:hypothetical protein
MNNIFIIFYFFFIYQSEKTRQPKQFAKFTFLNAAFFLKVESTLVTKKRIKMVPTLGQKVQVFEISNAVNCPKSASICGFLDKTTKNFYFLFFAR